VRKYPVLPDHLRSEISLSRTCNIPNLKVKNHWQFLGFLWQRQRANINPVNADSLS